MKLSTILILSFVFVGLVVSVGGTYYFYLQSTEILKENSFDHLETTAQSRAEHLETYLGQNIERLELITSKTWLRNHLKDYKDNPNNKSKEEIDKIIKDSKEPIEEFERICVVGLDGIVISSTDESFCGKDIQDKEFFIVGKEKSGVYFVEENDRRKIFVSGPFILEGELLGVGITVVSMDLFEEIIKDRTGLGETGEVLVAVQGKDERIYLFERLFEEEALSQEIEGEATAEPLKQALLGNEQVFENTLDYRNELVMAVSQFVEIGKIGLVAKIDLAELTGIARKQLIKISIILIIFMSVFVSLIGFFIARLVSKPIKKLTFNVDEITKGKLDIQLERSKIYEINRLTDSLNRILASLKLAILKTGATKGELGLGEAVKAKKEAEEKYKLLYESSRDAIMILEPPTWNFTAGNPATIKIFGAKDEAEFISKNPGELSSEKQPDGKLSSVKAKEMIGIALKNGSNSFEWTHKKVTGEEFLANVLLTKMNMQGKEVLQATVRDLSVKNKIPLKKIEDNKGTNKIVNKPITTKSLVEKSKEIKKIVKPVKENVLDKKVIVKKPIVKPLKKNIVADVKEEIKKEKPIEKKIVEKPIDKKLLKLKNEKRYFLKK
jgi:PAS domain S-box-containing protein